MSAVKKMCCTTSIPIFFAGEFFGEISGSWEGVFDHLFAWHKKPKARCGYRWRIFWSAHSQTAKGWGMV
jgi:hypothetical protein